MKSISIIILALLISRSISAQPTDTWPKGTDWKLYSTAPNELYELKTDTLAHLLSISLNTDTLINFLKDVTVIPKERAVGAAWMGSYWVSYNLKNQINILRVSKYGGFFMDEKDGSFYQLPIGERQSWLTYFLQADIRLESK